VTRSRQTTDGVEYGGGTDPTKWMTYTYNLAGALVEQQYPSGRVVKNVLDSNGDLAIVQSKKNASSGFWHYADAFSYNAAGAVTSMQLGNGRWESTQFNSRLQPVQIALGSVQSATNLLKLDYSYGSTQNNGNVLSQTITVPTVGANQGFTAVQSYFYDSLNRLKSAVENVTPHGGTQVQSWTQTFTFDRYGNRRFDEPNTTTIPKNCGTPPNQTVCPADVPIVNPTIGTSNNRLSSTGWQYDAAGNTTADPEGRSFIYDGENKQVEVRNASNAVIGQYRYDGDGRRVKKIVPSTGETTVFVYDASAKLVADCSTQVEPQTSAKVSYLTTDHLGSPRILTDQTGEVISRRDFHPFGEEIGTLAVVPDSPQPRTATLGYQTDSVRQKFTGYERDNETNLDYAQARMYGNSHGRFTSPDPTFLSVNAYNPQSWNRYTYVLNNPYLYTDPLGLWEIYYEDRYKEKKNKDGTVTKVFDRREVFVRKSQKDDNGASLAKQLGLTGKEATKFAEKIGDGNNIQLSKLGGDVGRVFNTVEDGLTAQKKFEDKNPDKAAAGRGPKDADCSETACRIAYPQQLFGTLTFSVQQADQAITTNNAKSVQESELRIPT
jgi:RHS repeat-associated protein